MDDSKNSSEIVQVTIFWVDLERDPVTLEVWRDEVSMFIYGVSSARARGLETVCLGTNVFFVRDLMYFRVEDMDGKPVYHDTVPAPYTSVFSESINELAKEHYFSNKMSANAAFSSKKNK